VSQRQGAREGGRERERERERAAIRMDVDDEKWKYTKREREESCEL
jgi:hypothetical protein